MAQFTIYKSTDASAPVLSGQAGALLTLLDAVLVNGYGSKSGAGWSIAYTATNKRVYRGGAGNRMYVRIVDDGAQTGGARDAVWRGAEGASDVDTLTNAFPTVAQVSDANHCIRKSASADSTARPWKIFADSKGFVLFLMTGDVASTYVTYAAGDQDAFYADSFMTANIGGNVSGTSALAAGVDNFHILSTAAGGSGIVNGYFARTIAGTGGSTQLGMFVPRIMTAAATRGGVNAWKNSGDGNILLEPLELSDVSPANMRGRARGLYCALHAATNFADGDTISGTGGYAGKTFEIVKGMLNSTSAFLVVETSNTLP